MRWVLASVAAMVVLLLTYPVVASGSSEGPDAAGSCTSATGLPTLGNSESCDVWGVAVSLPGAALAFGLVAWAWRSRDADPD